MSIEIQTSVFMNGNEEAQQTDASSGGRLLSTSGEDKSPRVRMTRPARFRVRVILVVLLIIIIAVAIILIVALTTKGSRNENEVDSPAFNLSHLHVRCKHDVMIASAGSNNHSHWKNVNSSAHEWKTFPNVHHTGFVLISPKYRLEAGYPGIQVSMLLPHDSKLLHVMAVTSKTRHSKTVTMAPSSNRCNSVALKDPSYFDGKETIFRVYVFYSSHISLKKLKFTVTSLPKLVTFKSVKLYSEPTAKPNFTNIRAGDRNKCSLEIHNGDVECDWWNVEEGDNDDFKSMETHQCIDNGVHGAVSDTWFFVLKTRDKQHEARALLVSPVIKRDTASVLFTLWYMFKCEKPHMKIHLVPSTASLHAVMGSSSVVAEITESASHSDWKFLTYQFLLPEEHNAYHIVIEGIVQADGECTNYACATDTFYGEPVVPSYPMLALDGISIELMHEQCEVTDKPNVMDCKFQNEDAESTLCEWKSSVPANVINMPGLLWHDWKAVNSGDENDHGATAQHFIGRGHVMTFDATGRYKAQGHLRTPLLKASKNCSCAMTFLYLMRGDMTPRMQLNLIYGTDINDDTRTREGQWSLFGHQSQDWETAVVSINLKTNSPFQVEIRVLHITDGRADVHFDDIEFIGCDMDKYETS